MTSNENKNCTLPRVSILIPTKDQVKILKRCIDSLLKVSCYPLSLIEIIVINNQSKQSETLQYLAELSELSFVRILQYERPFNFSAMNNMAVAHAKHDVVCLLNNDVEVISPYWLSEMSSFLSRENVGCIGAKLYYPNDTIQHAGVVLGINGVAGHVYKHCSRNCSGYNNHLLNDRCYSAVTAACMLVKKSVYLEVGGFDEVLAVAYNDVDFCLKLGQLGYTHVWTPKAELYHHESISRGKKKQRSWRQKYQLKKETNYMKNKWGALLLNDPAWSADWPLVETWCGQL